MLVLVGLGPGVGSESGSGSGRPLGWGAKSPGWKRCWMLRMVWGVLWRLLAGMGMAGGWLSGEGRGANSVGCLPSWYRIEGGIALW